jgi:GTP-binding protein
VVALVGRPNVGKSSLFNRLVGGRPALVEDLPGVTRDRRYGVCSWSGKIFRVVDTGGLDPSAAGVLGAMRTQTLRAVDEAVALIFVVDAVEGPTVVDEEVATTLRKRGKPVFVAANKVDSDKREAASAEAFSLGFKEVFPVSAAHGRGVAELLDAVLETLGDRALPDPELGGGEDESENEDATDGGDSEVRGKRDDAADLGGAGDDEGEDESDDGDEADLEDAADAPYEPPVSETRPTGPIRLAFVGKPNAGKSSLVNRLLGEERVLVHDQPGTTRDPIDTPFSFDGQDFVLIDTAGLRRRRSIESQTEAVAAKMARDQLARADVAVLVIDANHGASQEDARLASFIEEAGRPTVVVLNKRDLVPRAKIDAKLEETREALDFLSWAPVVMTSAHTGGGVAEIVKTAVKVFENAGRRISTGELNRFLEDAVVRQPPPSGPAGRHVRLYFVTQVSVRPPTFVFSTNQPAAIAPSYRRFLTNQLRKTYGFEGTPLRTVLRAHRKKRRFIPKAEDT